MRTKTVARLGLGMVSEYVSYNPPTNVRMTMVDGPWYFEQLGGGWRFRAEAGGTRAVWKYTYAVSSPWQRPLARRIGQVVLGREIRRRIDAFIASCENPLVLDAVVT